MTSFAPASVAAALAGASSIAPGSAARLPVAVSGSKPETEMPAYTGPDRASECDADGAETDDGDVRHDEALGLALRPGAVAAAGAPQARDRAGRGERRPARSSRTR